MRKGYFFENFQLSSKIRIFTPHIEVSHNAVISSILHTNPPCQDSLPFTFIYYSKTVFYHQLSHFLAYRYILI